MPKNIVIFSDGTGNGQGDGSPTNVELLFGLCRNDLPWPVPGDDALAVLLDGGGHEQVAFYDAGVGTEFGDLIGKATGKGISRNIRDCYEFLVKVYRPGDRIFLFGFSRGAYTVRSLAGLIGLVGVADRLYRKDDGGTTDLLFDPARRKTIVNEAYGVYKTGYGEGEEGARKRREAAHAFRERYSYVEHEPGGKSCSVYFIGVWDTVRSLGIPLGYSDWELTISPHRFHDHNLSPHVPYAFHALATDDNRLQFHPTIWNEPEGYEQELEQNGQTFEQVWFPGVHSNVGGGVEDRRLSDIVLNWMIERTQIPDHPMLFPDGQVPVIEGDAVNGAFYNVYKRLHARLFYRKVDRQVCRGVQEPVSKRIAKNGEAVLSDAWRARIKALYDAKYNPRHMGSHPEFPR